MGTFAHSAKQRFRNDVGPMPMAERRVVSRAIESGTVPADPEQHDRVYRTAVFRLEELRRQRPLLLIGLPLLLMLFAVAAVVDSPLYWIAVAGALALSLSWYWQFRRLERCVAALRPSAER